MISDGTIVAQATAQGNAARGIIRLSGDESLNAATSFFIPRSSSDDFPSEVEAQSKIGEDVQPQIISGWLKPWGNDEPSSMVKCFLFFWPKGRGFTGEQTVEIHLPGSAPILNAVVRTICSTGKARLAERGEFTLRAFLNGKLDLTQAEAILGTIDATSDGELKSALKQLSGSLSQKTIDLRNQLLDVLSELEAGFDFTEEDIEFISHSQIHDKLLNALEEVRNTLSKIQKQLSTDRNPRVLLVGRPNVGKSSLFNSLVDKYHGNTSGQAIVSDVAGTTRDFLEAELNVDGVSFSLLDAAGLETEFLPETKEASVFEPRKLAQLALHKAMDQAELFVKCFDSQKAYEELNQDTEELPLESVIEVVSKCDLAPSSIETSHGTPIQTSSESGFGIELLAQSIVQKLRAKTENSEIVPSTSLRCQESLRRAVESLQNALNILDNEALCDESLVAGELRLALNQIGLVAGQVHTDDLLDRIFSRFCIGK